MVYSPVPRLAGSTGAAEADAEAAADALAALAETDEAEPEAAAEAEAEADDPPDEQPTAKASMQASIDAQTSVAILFIAYLRFAMERVGIRGADSFSTFPMEAMAMPAHPGPS
ncbi:MAG TPA: hypothetical protein DCP91_10265 [Eggerthellaceae bacterium]|nr:hypothetical protein [Eggerthellaceae bacterium]